MTSTTSFGCEVPFATTCLLLKYNLETLSRVQRDTADKDKVVSLENKIRELGLEVEMEQSQKTRTERTIKKLKDSLADVRSI